MSLYYTKVASQIAGRQFEAYAAPKVRPEALMSVMTLLDAKARPLQPEPITDAEAAAMFRAVVRLFSHWELADEQAAMLLDVSVRTYQRWKAGGPGKINRDRKARLSNMLGIHKALRTIFTDAARAYRWIKAPNRTFEGRSALDVMLGGELTDLMRVRRYLENEGGQQLSESCACA
jgi:uncharacterized protein (DUF2384 family)